jgi:hypothetical protein
METCEHCGQTYDAEHESCSCIQENETRDPDWDSQDDDVREE